MERKGHYQIANEIKTSFVIGTKSSLCLSIMSRIVGMDSMSATLAGTEGKIRETMNTKKCEREIERFFKGNERGMER